MNRTGRNLSFIGSPKVTVAGLLLLAAAFAAGLKKGEEFKVRI